MKKLITLLAIAWMITGVCAQSSDSLLLVKQEKRIVALEKQFQDLKQQNIHLQEVLAQLGQENQGISSQLATTDSTLANMDERYGTHISQTDKQLSETHTEVQYNEAQRKSSVLWGIVIAALLALVLGLVYLLLRIRISQKGNDIEQLRTRADDLNRQIVERMDKESEELLRIFSQISHSDMASNSSPDHSLVKALADRITFMEMTLYRMDPSVKGHKHLTRSLRQMKDNLLANGYEIVDMLGKDYVEGMKASPSFNDDDELEQGKRIITGITKPQINYKGQMIQAAQITVSQNI